MAALAAAPTVVFASPTGSASAPGTSESPAALSSALLERADEAVLLPGVYSLPEGLVIQDRTRQLMIRAKTPGTVVLVGGRPAKAAPEGRFLRISDTNGASAVLENLRPMRLARTPNDGYFAAEGAGPDAARQVKLPPQAAGLLTGSLEHFQLFSWPGWNWFTNRGPVKSFDQATRIVETSELPGYAYRQGNRFRLEGDSRLVDQAGEFGFDPRGIRLLPSAKSASYTLVTAPSLLHIKNSQHVRILGLDLVGAKGDVVRIEDSTRTEILECLVAGGGETGIKSVGLSQQGAFIGCLIELNGQHGIDMQGPGQPEAFANGRNTILSNRVRRNGLRFGHGYGISMHSSCENRILRNHISEQPRYGISFKGDGPPATSDGSLRQWPAGKYRPSRANVVQGNRIENVNLDSEDTGAIEAWNSGRDNIIDGNWIGRTGNPGQPIMSGLYIDDGADGFSITNNVITSATGSHDNQAVFVKGVDNRLENNVLIVGPDAKAAIASMEMAGQAARRHIYRGNAIFFAPRPVSIPGREKFGEGAGNLQEPGTTITMPIVAPKAGRAVVWVRYASRSADFGVPSMSGQSSLSIGSSRTVLEGLENTKDWGDYQWAKTPSGELATPSGRVSLVWRNDKGGGINIDAFLLDYTGKWTPDQAPSGPGIVVVHPESVSLPERRSIVHWLVNESPDRISVSDGSLLLGDTKDLAAFVGGRTLDWIDWQKTGRDKSSRAVPSPFVDAARGDFRLKPGTTGFRPLPLGNMGLGREFPARLRR